MKPEPEEESEYSGMCAGDLRRAAFAAAGMVGGKERDATHSELSMIERWRDRPAQRARRAAAAAKDKLAGVIGKPGRPRSVTLVTGAISPPWVSRKGGRVRVPRGGRWS